MFFCPPSLVSAYSSLFLPTLSCFCPPSFVSAYSSLFLPTLSCFYQPFLVSTYPSMFLPILPCFGLPFLVSAYPSPFLPTYPSSTPMDSRSSDPKTLQMEKPPLSHDMASAVPSGVHFIWLTAPHTWPASETDKEISKIHINIHKHRNTCILTIKHTHIRTRVFKQTHT